MILVIKFLFALSTNQFIYHWYFDTKMSSKCSVSAAQWNSCIKTSSCDWLCCI